MLWHGSSPVRQPENGVGIACRFTGYSPIMPVTNGALGCRLTFLPPKNKIVETRGAYFHAIGGIETNARIACSVKPSVHMDEWVGQLKGASSFEMGKGLQWQAGYGIVSFGTKDLKSVVDYVRNPRTPFERNYPRSLGAVRGRGRRDHYKPVNGLVRRRDSYHGLKAVAKRSQRDLVTCL